MSIATGWDNSINYFLSKGYTSAELYATTWGDANEMNAETRTHDCATLVRLRHFLEAVIAYTGAKQIDIISHSMGVTLARKLIQGGTPAGGKTFVDKALNYGISRFLQSRKTIECQDRYFCWNFWRQLWVVHLPV